jgi:O-acetyl-ADP-ribose deacetylase (regulator of RNase III)
MPAKVVEGDIFKVKTKYIAHQCNCITLKGGHLSKTMFSHYPFADIYKTRERVTNWRETRDRPGTIIVKGNGDDERYVINMLGQIFPGKPKYTDSKSDGFNARITYFGKCLVLMSKIEDLESVAFPWRIGCGAAGNDWNKYSRMINIFADKVDAKVFIVKLPE